MKKPAVDIALAGNITPEMSKKRRNKKLRKGRKLAREMRTDMDQLKEAIVAEDLFNLWRRVAVGTAKQNKEDAVEYQNIKIPDHKTAVCIQASKSINLPSIS